ncbi:unnamed protein product [Brachionus calyciflorus]|uniref:Uncharacterized protein n=1 Tax=Brachionus calyciflorus TaxID=104777 RepID=A0A813WR05_9BILA|nr:unnamed protein product [Brachionus calyciflorus]
MFSGISKWLEKFKSVTQTNPQIPKSFKQKNRSIFLNRYAGIVYFIVVWHAFGYVLISSAKKKVDLEGLDMNRVMAQGSKVKKIEINKNFEIKTTEI